MSGGAAGRAGRDPGGRTRARAAGLGGRLRWSAPVAHAAVGPAAVQLPELPLRNESVAERLRIVQRVTHARGLGTGVVRPVQHFRFERERGDGAAELELAMVRKD